MFKVNNRNNLQHISHLFLVFLMFTLSKEMLPGQSLPGYLQAPQNIL